MVISILFFASVLLGPVASANGIEGIDLDPKLSKLIFENLKEKGDVKKEILKEEFPGGGDAETGQSKTLGTLKCVFLKDGDFETGRKHFCSIGKDPKLF